MKPKQMMLFAVAIGCGLVAMLGAQQVLSGNKAPEQEMVKILCAKTDIDAGVLLDDSNVVFKDWPVGNVLEGAITTKEEYVEHASKIKVSPNMPILKSYLGPKGQAGFASLIPKGMTVTTLPVDLTMTHSGLLRPGSFVSVTCAVTRQARGADRTESTMIRTVLKRVKVLAVGSQIAGSDATSKDGTPAKVENVSFVTFPRQANLLNLAMIVSNRRMQFTLLGEEDQSTDDTEDLDETALAQRSAELMGEGNKSNQENQRREEPNSVAAKPEGSSFGEYLKRQPIAIEVAELGKQPARPTWKMEIYKGNTKEVHELELPGSEVAVEPAVVEPKRELSLGDQLAPLFRFFTSTTTKNNNPSTAPAANDSNDLNAGVSKETDLPSDQSAAKQSGGQSAAKQSNGQSAAKHKNTSQR